MELALPMGLLLERNTNINGGRPLTLGTLVYDKESGRHGVLLGYADKNIGKGEKVLLPINLLNQFIRNLNRGYDLEIHVRRKRCFRELFVSAMDKLVDFFR